MFYFLGFIVCLYYFQKIIKKIYVVFLRKPYDLSKRYGNNTWVLITGASDGIGKEFCISFAKQKFNICLIARNKEKLEAVAKDLETKFNVKTQSIIADFTESSIDFYQKIEEQIKDLDVSILVNNVGIAEPFELVVNNSEKELKNLLNVNITSQVMMSRLIIPKMIKRNQRSAIINVASLIKHFYLPYIITYGATKCFNDYFSEGLDIEYFEKIDSLSFCPYFVTTNLSNLKKEKGLIINTEKAVKGCLRDLGYKSQSYGHWKHEILPYFFWINKIFSKSKILKDQEKIYNIRQKKAKKTN